MCVKLNETFEKYYNFFQDQLEDPLFWAGEGEYFNQRNTLTISRIKI